ncbi:MAG: sugar ABC transporter permease [Anaerolineae bacterium]
MTTAELARPYAPARLERARDFVRRHRFEIVLISPLFLYVFGTTLIPVFASILLGFQEPPRGGAFPSLDSYKLVVQNYQFASAFTNTLIITFMSVSLEMVLGLMVAMMMARPFEGRGIFRAIILLPLGIPVVVAASNMRYIFLSSGYLNEALIDLNLITQPIDWLADPLALLTVAISDMWKVTPLVMLILLAGLESIPRELYEAAQVDGSNVWQRFRYITLPLLRPAITSAVVIRGIDAFRIFAHPMGLGVGRTVPVLSTFGYYEYQRVYYTTSAATSTILLVMILVAVVLYIRLAGTEEITG